MRTIKRAIWAATFLAAAVVWWIDSAPGTSHDGTIAVPPDTMPAQVVRRLSEEGQVRFPGWFKAALRATGADRRLKVGLYPVRKGDSALTLAWRLRAGRGVTVKVTIPEGWTAEKIADRLGAAGVCGREEFLEAVRSADAEGFLFPETYQLEPYASGARVRDVLTARFGAAWRETTAAVPLAAVEASTVSPRFDRVRFSDGRWWTAKEAATLASIVEREGGRPEDLPKIAAVYRNRLRKGMPLEADPTVQYALGRWKERLFYKDLLVESPYNTYRHAGLPPGPIGNPGRAALRAALAPAEAPFLYFVADEEGGHVFSVTYGEHLRHVAEYRRKRAAAAR